jgi:branched-chain amino acid transport system ATP-binding protein
MEDACKPARAAGVSSLRLDHVTKHFGGVEAVADLSIAFERQRITGLIGPNGAGKTTVVNLITGIVQPSAGAILLGDRPLADTPPHVIARLGIARTFQNVRLLPEASVLDNIVVGFHRHERTGLLANTVGMPAIWRERREFRARAADLLERFGLVEFAARPAGALSYGHRRLVEVMRALAMAPDFLLLDEPAAGMNDVENRTLGQIIRGLAEEGIGIVLIEHNMRFVMEVCDLIYVIDSGHLIAQGTAETVRADPAVIRAYLGG